MAIPNRTAAVAGPLAAHEAGLAEDLRRQGYSPLSIQNLLRLTAQLDRWAAVRSLRPADLTVTKLAAFLRYRRRLGFFWQPTIRGLDPVLRYLRRTGVIPEAQVPMLKGTPVSDLIDRYGRYLVHERSLSAAGTRQYQDVARRFLSSVTFGHLRTADVSGFVLAEARRSSVGYAKIKVTALRSFLRYLHVCGEIPGDLSGAVPAIAGWRLSGLPRALDADHTRRLLRAFDRRTRAGRRGYAAVMLMLRMGLRANEVASLTLDDCDWARGELTIRGKQGREDRLPIPRDVGEAVVSYLRLGRPHLSLRGLFLSERAPHRNMTRQMVTHLVRDAGRRCGIASLGAHRLRHTAATRMLRKGTPLHEIGQVLRHRSVDTTAIYAKVDHKSLRLVCRAWPGVTP